MQVHAVYVRHPSCPEAVGRRTTRHLAGRSNPDWSGIYVLQYMCVPCGPDHPNQASLLGIVVSSQIAIYLPTAT